MVGIIEGETSFNTRCLLKRVSPINQDIWKGEIRDSEQPFCLFRSIPPPLHRVFPVEGYLYKHGILGRAWREKTKISGISSSVPPS